MHDDYFKDWREFWQVASFMAAFALLCLLIGLVMKWIK